MTKWMKTTREYLTPDYYGDFHCKMGACRAACCVGWPISLSMKDYFSLLGVECSPELRRRLDTGMCVKRHPTEDSYAEILPRFDGNCSMRLPDGRCAVHAELGEDALSAVCNLYPRGPRIDGDPECSCANSCEAVLELFLKKKEPIRFVKRELTFDLPAPTARHTYFETLGREQELRLHFISILQNRALPLHDRILSLGLSLTEMEIALRAKDAAKVDELLRKAPALPDDRAGGVEARHLSAGLTVAERMVRALDERSDSLREHGEAALAYFGEGEAALERYRAGKARFEAALPQWEIFFEHVLVNHMFFERFPFQDRPETMYEEFVAICAGYALLRFLAVGMEKPTEERFVDAAAAAFRLVDHTAFDRYASHLLHDLGCDEPEQIYDLIRL